MMISCISPFPMEIGMKPYVVSSNEAHKCSTNLCNSLRSKQHSLYYDMFLQLPHHYMFKLVVLDPLRWCCNQQYFPPLYLLWSWLPHTSAKLKFIITIKMSDSTTNPKVTYFCGVGSAHNHLARLFLVKVGILIYSNLYNIMHVATEVHMILRRFGIISMNA